ncbi:MAG TPA: CBS domain-containing protein [Longimicrobiales bacterium]|nr:CBS domain-containing protein [Longimicrobiales bacterium]
MVVRELLKRKPGGVISVSPSASVQKAARLMMRHGVGGLPVVDDDGALVGFISEREVVDAVDRSAEDVLELRVAFLMRQPAPACRSDDGIQQVMRRMTRDRLRHLVVVEEGRIRGVISVGDLVKQRLEELETEAGVLRDYIAAQRARR